MNGLNPKINFYIQLCDKNDITSKYNIQCPLIQI